jgi:type I restriction enzyme S subunit
MCNRLLNIEKIIDRYNAAEKNLYTLNVKFPDQLKKSILQSAVQGKLVPQDENDEPASVLLERIRAEKEQLIKDGKLKKEKPLPPINEDEIPFDVPDSWEWVRLEMLSVNIHYGYTASAAESGNSKLLRITDIQDNIVQWETVPYCNPSDREYSVYGLINRDILIARTGGTIGKSYIVRNLSERAVFASYLIRVIPLEAVFEEYLKVFLETPLYWEQLKKSSMGTGQPNVNGQSLKSLMMPLPPLAEQHRIVGKCEELMSMVDGLQISVERGR